MYVCTHLTILCTPTITCNVCMNVCMYVCMYVHTSLFLLHKQSHQHQLGVPMSLHEGTGVPMSLHEGTDVPMSLHEGKQRA
jgi:hypothetical protein